MALTLNEIFTYVTMVDGVKDYASDIKMTHTLTAYTISDVKSNNKQSQIGGQTSTPTTQLLGKNPDNLRITGKVCELSGVDGIISSMSGYRVVSALYNLFLVGSYVQVGDSDSTGISGLYIVDEFTIRRNIRNRTLITFELGLLGSA